MTGQWYFTHEHPAQIQKKSKHLRWGLMLEDSQGRYKGFLWFNDTRKFGTLEKVDDLAESKSLSKLGPDGLDLNSIKTVYEIVVAAKKSKRPIKTLILDQKVIAGVGNIYASEALFESKISPFSRSKDLSSEQIENLCGNIYSIFLKSIELGGSSISDFSGGFYHEVLKVYGRDGEDCLECKSKIERCVQAGRSTFYCPKCQGVEENEFY